MSLALPLAAFLNVEHDWPKHVATFKDSDHTAKMPSRNTLLDSPQQHRNKSLFSHPRELELQELSLLLLFADSSFLITEDSLLFWMDVYMHLDIGLNCHLFPHLPCIPLNVSVGEASPHHGPVALNSRCTFKSPWSLS